MNPAGLEEHTGLPPGKIPGSSPALPTCIIGCYSRLNKDTETESPLCHFELPLGPTHTALQFLCVSLHVCRNRTCRDTLGQIKRLSQTKLCNTCIHLHLKDGVI